jgi:hypothetical protein
LADVDISTNGRFAPILLKKSATECDFPFVGLAIFARQSALIAMDEFGYVSDIDLMPDGLG